MKSNLPKYFLINPKWSKVPVRTPANLRNILKKEPSFDNGFVKLRSCHLNIKLKDLNLESGVLNYELHGPQELFDKMDSGEIVINDEEFNKELQRLVNYKLQYYNRKANPARAWSSD